MAPTYPRKKTLDDGTEVDASLFKSVLFILRQLIRNRELGAFVCLLKISYGIGVATDDNAFGRVKDLALVDDDGRMDSSVAAIITNSVRVNKDSQIELNFSIANQYVEVVQQSSGRRDERAIGG